MDTLNSRMLARYQRQMVLPEVGMEGQRRLMQSRVLIVGAGALGSAAAMYLAAAGVGTIGLVDGDTVELSNLHRQILHDDNHIGDLKTHSAKERLQAVNPHIHIQEHQEFLSRENTLQIFSQYDLILNGSDNFPARYLVNDAAVLLKKPLIDAAILRFEGQLFLYRPGHGCYRCLFPVPPAPGTVPDCAIAGVFGAVAGVMGSTEAVEALKVLLNIGQSNESLFMLYDALSSTWQRMPFDRRATCALCGNEPSITSLIDYESFCRTASEPVDRPAEDSHEEVSVSIARAQQLLRLPNTTLIDVRSTAEFSSGHVPEALHYPMERLDCLLDPSPPSGQILVLCAAGVRSAYASQYLRSHGVDAYSVQGGTTLWQKSGAPWIEKSPPLPELV